MKRWQWDYVQEDLKELQAKAKQELGLDYTLEEVYDIWTAYSESLCANWIYVDKDYHRAFK